MDLQSTSQERKAAKAVLCGLNLKDTPEHYAVTMKELGELAKALDNQRAPYEELIHCDNIFLVDEYQDVGKSKG